MTKVVCPACNHRGTTVLQSRSIGTAGLPLPPECYRGSGPKRRHECKDCGFRWTTHEIAVPALEEHQSKEPRWPELISLHIEKETK